MKNILKFLFIFALWVVPVMFFNFDMAYYNSLNLPFFTPDPFVFSIVWTIIYFLISINIYMITNNFNLNDIKEYRNSLIINYIFNMLFTFFFITLKSPFLAFVDTIIVFLSTLFLYYESKSLDSKSSIYLIPYVIWSMFAVLLSVSIYFLNL